MTLFDLKHHSLLIIKGPDSFKFLQGQTTCDINQLISDDHHHSVLGAHCNHQGRMLFNFRAVAFDNETIALKLPSSTLEVARNALGKYIVFSKAEILDSTENYSLYGTRTEDNALLSQLFDATPKEINQAIISNGSSNNSAIIKTDNDHYELWINEEQQLLDKISSDNNSITIESSLYWQQHLMQKKVPEITSDTSGLFTPHAVSFQDIGVDFQKGCYTGQEVVARMHYLGKSKKQLFLFELENSNALPSPGQPLYSNSKAIGEVVNICQKENDLLVLASANVEVVEKGPVYIDQEQKKSLNLIH